MKFHVGDWIWAALAYQLPGAAVRASVVFLTTASGQAFVIQDGQHGDDFIHQPPGRCTLAIPKSPFLLFGMPGHKASCAFGKCKLKSEVFGDKYFRVAPFLGFQLFLKIRLQNKNKEYFCLISV